MPFLIAIAVTLALVQVDDEPPIVVQARPWAPFISPMGEPFRAIPTGEDPLARWFHHADNNRDGLLTEEEMRADAVRFFQTLDANNDREIDPEELVVYETQVAPEVQVNSRWKRNRQSASQSKPEARKDGEERWRADANVDGYQVHGLQGAARYGLLNIPQPVASADADFDRGTTLVEFQRAATERFKLLDSKRTGRILLADLETRLPARPQAGTRAKRSKETTDTRVGQPFPAKD